MPSSQIFHVQSAHANNTCWRWELSVFDHVIPPTYMKWCMVFPLEPLGATSEKKDHIVHSIKSGLARTIADMPILAGALQRDPTSGRLFVQRHGAGDTIELAVKHLDTTHATNTYTPYKVLEDKGFPVSMLKPSILLPYEDVDGKHDFFRQGISEAPVMMVQLTFIPGAVVVGSKVHHQVSDGPGHDLCHSIWATHSSDCFHAVHTNSTRRFDVSMDRSSLIWRGPIPGQARVQELGKRLARIAVYGIEPPTMPPTELLTLPLASAFYHFPKSSITFLRRVIAKQNSDQAQMATISSYDAMMALMWRCVIRARMPLLQLSRNDETSFAHNVSITGRHVDSERSSVSSNYFGVTAFHPRAGPVTVGTLLGPGGLAIAALMINQSTKNVNTTEVENAMEWFSEVDPRTVGFTQQKSQLGPDLFATSWKNLSCYRSHDFGFGLPEAGRWPALEWEGAIIYPPKSSSNTDEGFEVSINLEISCQKRLLVDPELRGLVEPRGLDPELLEQNMWSHL